MSLFWSNPLSPNSFPMPHHFSFQLHVLFLTLFFPPCLSFLSLPPISLSPLSAACLCTDVGPPAGGWATSQRLHPWRKQTLPPHQPLAAHSSSEKGGLHETPPLHLTWSCTGLMHTVASTMSSFVQHARQTLFCYRYLLPLTLTFFLAVFHNDPWTLKQGVI